MALRSVCRRCPALTITQVLEGSPEVEEDVSVFGPLDVDELKSRLGDDPTGKSGRLPRSHLHCGPARPLQVEPGRVPAGTRLFSLCIDRYISLGRRKVPAHRGTGPSLGSGVGTGWNKPSAAQEQRAIISSVTGQQRQRFLTQPLTSSM